MSFSCCAVSSFRRPIVFRYSRTRSTSSRDICPVVASSSQLLLDLGLDLGRLGGALVLAMEVEHLLGGRLRLLLLEQLLGPLVDGLGEVVERLRFLQRHQPEAVRALTPVEHVRVVPGLAPVDQSRSTPAAASSGLPSRRGLPPDTGCVLSHISFCYPCKSIAGAQGTTPLGPLYY